VPYVEVGNGKTMALASAAIVSRYQGGGKRPYTSLFDGNLLDAGLDFRLIGTRLEPN
jgi:hypothetical protein